jgi:hypothetical protein
LKEVFLEFPHEVAHFHALLAHHRHHALLQKDNFVKLLTENVHLFYDCLLVDAPADRNISLPNDFLTALVLFVEIAVRVGLVVEEVARPVGFIGGVAEGDSIISIHA